LSENANVNNDAATVASPKEHDTISYTMKGVADREGSVKRYTVEIERIVYEKKLVEMYRDLRKSVVIDGFRKGKAPVQLLKNRFGKEAQEDSFRDMAMNIADQIVENDKIAVIGDPSLEGSKAEEGQPVELEIDIEVQPKIDPAGYTGHTVEVELEAIPADAVARELESVREANATYEELGEERGYAKGDAVTCDIEVVDADGKRMESLCQKNAFLRAPEQTFLPEVVADLAGKKPGDSFTTVCERTVKDDTYKDTFTIAVKEIKKRVLPDLDDDFAQDVGDFKSLDDLKTRIAQDLEEQREHQKRQMAIEKLLDKIIEANPFDAPRTVVAQQEYQTIMRDSRTLQQMGLSFETMGQTTESYLENTRANAQRFVKVSFLINAIAEKEDLKVSDEDIEKEIQRQAEATGRKALAVRARLEAQKQLDNLRRSLLVGKVEEFLMAGNTTTVVEKNLEA
jgi:trigger factor